MTTGNTPKPMTPEEIEQLKSQIIPLRTTWKTETALRLIATIDHLRQLAEEKKFDDWMEYL